MIFLPTFVTECLNRCQTRGRMMEKSIDITYLQTLHQQYNNHIEWWQHRFGADRVYSVESNDLYTQSKEVLKFIQSVVSNTN